MFVAEATIQNEAGIHCRPSAVIIKMIEGYHGTIRVSSDHGCSDLKSMMSLLSMGLYKNTVVKIEVDGPNEEVVGQKLVNMFQYHFDFSHTEGAAERSSFDPESFRNQFG